MDNSTPSSPITPTPPTPPSPHTKPTTYVVILIGILLLLFVAPTPYYQSEEVSCKPGQTNCPRIGWHWNKSLYQSLIGYIRYSSRSQVSQVDTPTPTPLPAETPAEWDTVSWKTYTSGMSFAFLYPPTWFVTETGSTQFPNLRIQNYDPATAPGRGYDSTQDKGKYLLSVGRLPVGDGAVYDLDQLIARLPKEGDQAYYLGDPAGQIRILKNERGIVNGFPKLIREVSYSKFTDVIENDIYLLNKKGDAIIIHMGLDAINGKKIPDQILSTFKFVEQNETANWKEYSFPNVGLTFKAPANLSVELTETKNSNTGASVGYSLYIQNNSTDIKKFYQLYGTYQNPPNTNYSEKDLEVHKQDLIPNSITSIIIDGHIGTRGQISGQRNRFVTHLLINNGFLSLFTAEPTMDNEKLSNQIIDTFKFTR